ncbi:hypothetical protein [Streptomyces sp. NPDC060022]
MNSQPFATGRFVFERTPSIFECSGGTPSVWAISLQLNEAPRAGSTAIRR